MCICKLFILISVFYSFTNITNILNISYKKHMKHTQRYKIKYCHKCEMYCEGRRMKMCVIDGLQLLCFINISSRPWWDAAIDADAMCYSDSAGNSWSYRSLRWPVLSTYWIVYFSRQTDIVRLSAARDWCESEQLSLTLEFRLNHLDQSDSTERLQHIMLD